MSAPIRKIELYWKSSDGFQYAQSMASVDYAVKELSQYSEDAFPSVEVFIGDQKFVIRREEQKK